MTDSSSDTSSFLIKERGGHYVGTDRRAAPPPDLDRGLGGLGVVAAAFIGLWIAVEGFVLSGASLPASLSDPGLRSLLQAVGAALGGVVTALAFVRWKLIGETRVLWLGVATFFIGPIAAVALGLIPAVLTGPPPAIIGNVVVPAAHLVAIGSMIAAALVPEVDTRVRPRTAMALTVVAALALALALALLPTVRSVLTGTIGWAGLGIAWSSVAIVHLVAARRTRRRNHVAVVVVASGLAFAATTQATLIGLEGSFTSGPHLLVAIALGTLMAQGLRDLEIAFCVQRERLLDRQVVVETEQARRQVEATHEGQRRHDARNALMAIQGATFVLDRHRDRLDDDRRHQLTNAVTGEVAHLQELIETSRGPTAFMVADLIDGVLEGVRTTGSRIDVDVAPDLAAVGRALETAAVVQRLVHNAHAEAPGQPVTVRSERDGDWVVIYVEDRGRGVDRRDRHTLFDADHETDDAGGLTLFVCRRLMLDQHGDLWVENRPGGGTSFALCLPYATSERPESTDSPDRGDTTETERHDHQEVSAR